jgi:predicted amidohydrolase/GNAT superfamily N-acetyltransferase
MQDTIVELRHLQFEDFIHLKVAMLKAYPGVENPAWDDDSIERLLTVFPEGQLCVVVNGEAVGAALSLVINYADFGDDHTYEEVTGGESFSTHNRNGDVLYGIDVFIHPDFRGLRLGRRLYDARKELCEQLNLRAIIAGGRIPNYNKYAAELTPKEYIQKVKDREVFDPVLSFQLANDFHVRKILRKYLPGDKPSKEYATLLEWNNIYYEPNRKLLRTQKSRVRIGLVQWQMRLFSGLGALLEQVEYFIDAVSDYQSDFILFPEFFNAPLMASYNHLGEAKAIRELATYTEKLRDKFVEFAVSYNVNIIGGSMPSVDEEGKLRNISYLCRRDGTWEYYYKIHITPSESDAWGMVGGNSLRVFDTDCGKVGILICYDVEFPELARIYAEQGIQLLFVPFLTDTQNGYNRVRKCAEARAVENECYVAMAGCVGNLPRVNNMDINYAKSAIFTPSDFAFPTDGVKAEATPNTEMTVIADVDLELLKELHTYGSVRNLKDRRSDLYKVQLVSTRKKK